MDWICGRSLWLKLCKESEVKKKLISTTIVAVRNIENQTKMIGNKEVQTS